MWYPVNFLKGGGAWVHLLCFLEVYRNLGSKLGSPKTQSIGSLSFIHCEESVPNFFHMHYR